MKVYPFHTKHLTEGAGHRNVYHDNDRCSEGNRIKPWDREPGTDGRPKCEQCMRLV